MYIQVIVPVKLAFCPTYSTDQPVHRGQRVVVPLARCNYTAVVYRTDVTPDIDKSIILPITAVAGELPDITPQEISFWEFISEYYLCTIGEVYKTAYPIVKVKGELTAARKNEFNREPKAPQSKKRGCAKPVLFVGSGRNAEYLRLAKEARAEGGQVLILEPEKNFANAMAADLAELQPDLFTSDISPVKRRKIPIRLRDGEPLTVIGTRASLFLPYSNLSLIIIDQEQDNWHKQIDPAPRFNARDAAVALASIHGASVVLGSATPSLESELNCISGKYERITLPSAGHCVPEIICTNAERGKNGMEEAFSYKLVEAVRECEGKVTIVRCWEKEEDVRKQCETLFPGREVNVCTLQDVERGETQDLIALLQADAFVSRSDFRADERAMQLVSELSDICRRLIIQTAVPERFNGSRSTGELLAERKEFAFPPYTRIVDINIEDSSAGRLALNSKWLARQTGLTPMKISDTRLKLRAILKRGKNLQEEKARLYSAVREVETDRNYQGHITIDVDPQ